MTNLPRAALVAGAIVALAGRTPAQAAPASSADEQAKLEALQKAAQNPVAKMVSIPFQLNTSYGGQTQNTLNIQPVYPLTLSKRWNLILRTIIPIVWQPTGTGDNSYYSGIGSTNVTAFLSPARPGKIIWGVGPTVNLPSTSPQLAPSGGSRDWSAGPAINVLTMPGHWVIGIIANQTWSFAGPSGYPYWSQFYSQVFIFYNLKKGWHLTTAPIITANWTAGSGDVWTVPVGGGFGRLVKLEGKLPVNINLSAYGYALKPAGGPSWTMRTQVAILLPES